MATGWVVKGICKDYLTCSICLSKYTDPRQLRCGHSFCLKCLDQYVKPEMTFLTCPLCRATMVIPDNVEIKEWIETLPKDDLLKSIIMTIEQNTEYPITDEEKVRPDKPACKHDVCAKHGLELAYFCFDHSDNFCDGCVFSDHNQCDYAHFSQIHLKITSLLNEMDCNILKRLEDLKCVENQGLKSLVAFQSQKRVVSDRLVQLRQKFEDFSKEMIANIAKKEDYLNSLEEGIKYGLSNIENRRAALEDTRSSTFCKEADVVLNAKDVSNLRSQLKELLEQDIIDSSCFGRFQIVFKENERFKSMLNEITDIGTLDICRVIPESPSESDQSKTTDNYYSFIDSETLVQTYSRKEFSVHEGQCTLSGCCIAQSCMIMIDQYNNCVIKTDFDGNVSERFTLQDPHQVCTIGDNRVVVTCWDQMKLYILDVQHKITLVRAVNTKKQYLGVHRAEGFRLLVTSPDDSSIDVISMDGEMVYTIESKRTRNILFSLLTESGFIPLKAIMKNADVIICDVKQKCVFRLDLAGKCVWKRQIPGISGFACGQNGIYCTQSSLNKIILLNFEGLVIDSSFIKMKHPWSIDIIGSMMLITEDSPSGKCSVFRLNLDIDHNIN